MPRCCRTSAQLDFSMTSTFRSTQSTLLLALLPTAKLGWNSPSRKIPQHLTVMFHGESYRRTLPDEHLLAAMERLIRTPVSQQGRCCYRHRDQGPKLTTEAGQRAAIELDASHRLALSLALCKPKSSTGSCREGVTHLRRCSDTPPWPLCLHSTACRGCQT